MKKGRLSNIEKQFITDNCDHKTYDLIAKELDRDPISIKNYIETKLNKETSLASGGAPLRNVKNDLATMPVWPILQAQFSPVELDILKYNWNNIQVQFDHDILPTEELQILDLIKMEVMMYRSLNEQKRCADMSKRLETEMEMLRDEPDSNEREDKLRRIQAELQIVSAGFGGLNKDYREIQVQKNKLFSELKATRKDRIQRIDSKKESFISWIEDLIENPQTRKALGIKMEKMRLATEKEEKRLADYHKYDDGMVDQPILNHRTVKDDNE